MTNPSDAGGTSSGGAASGGSETLSRGAAEHAALEQEVAAVVARFRRADDERLAAARAALTALLTGENGETVRGIVEKVVRGELLEVQWEVEEVLDETAPASAQPEPEPEPEPEPRRRLEEKKAPVLEAATAHVKDVGRGTGAVEDVVVVQYEGSQVPLVVREDQSLGAAAATWCRAERPKDRHCVRALGVLAATSKLR